MLWTALMPVTYGVLIDWFALGVWNGSSALRWYVYVPVLVYWVVALRFNGEKVSPRQVQLESA